MMRLAIDGYQRTQRAPSMAYIDRSRAKENEGNGQITDQHSQHRLSNSMSLGDKCNRWTKYALQQIF